MKPILLLGMGFALGAAVGYGACVIVQKKMKSAQSVEPAEDDSSDDEDEFQRRREAFMAGEYDRVIGKKVVVVPPQAPIMPVELRKKVAPKTVTREPANEYERAKVDYAAFSKPKSGADALAGIEEDDILAPVDPIPPIGDDDIGEDGQEPVVHQPPLIIPSKEFDEGKPHYEKVTLFYYPIDDTVATEGEDIQPAPEDFLGEDALGMLSPTNQCVYVRNDSLGIDYEVVLVPGGSYQEMIEGGSSPSTKAMAAAYHIPK